MSRSSPACLAPAITELSTYGVAEVQERNGVITIQNRRMVRECHTRENARLRKQNERVRKKSRVSHNASSYSSSISRERPPSGALSQPREAPPEAREVPPADENTSERASKSRFSLKECEQYAASVKGIKQPKAWAKTIWRSGEDDDAIGEFLGNSGNVMKKQPDKPVDVAEIKRLADDLDAMKHHEAAQALRASIQGK